MTVNPGYPFFVAAVAGHRPPHPPFFTEFDGGLPRHVVVGGTFTEKHTRLDFSKHMLTANAITYPELGTPAEVVAMDYHAKPFQPSFNQANAPANFITNGLPAAMGAPYADPCKTDDGVAVPAALTRTLQERRHTT